MCTSGPSLVAKFSSRSTREPSGSAMTLATPVVSCSWLTNAPSASTPGAGCAGAGGDAEAGAEGATVAPAEPTGAPDPTAGGGSADTLGSASSIVLRVNTFQGWKAHSPATIASTAKGTRTSAAVRRRRDLSNVVMPAGTPPASRALPDQRLPDYYADRPWALAWTVRWDSYVRCCCTGRAPNCTG